MPLMVMLQIRSCKKTQYLNNKTFGSYLFYSFKGLYTIIINIINAENVLKSLKRTCERYHILILIKHLIRRFWNAFLINVILTTVAQTRQANSFFTFVFFVIRFLIFRSLIFNALLKSFEKLTLRQMIAIIILFYYNHVSMLLASFSSWE